MPLFIASLIALVLIVIAMRYGSLARSGAEPADDERSISTGAAFVGLA